MLSFNTFVLVGFVLQGLCDVGSAHAIPYDAPRAAGNPQRLNPNADTADPSFPAGLPSLPGNPFPTGLPSLPSGLPLPIPSSLPSLISGLPSLPSSLPSLLSGLPSLPSGLPSLPSGLPNLPSGLPSLPSGLVPKLPLPTGFPSAGSDKQLKAAGNPQKPNPKADAPGLSFPTGFSTPPGNPFPTGLPSLPSGLPLPIPSSLPSLISGLPSLPSSLPSLLSGLPSLPSGLPSLPSGLPNLPSGLPSLPSGLVPKLPLPTGFPSTGSDKPSKSAGNSQRPILQADGAGSSSGLPSLPSGLIPKLPSPTGSPSTGSDKISMVAAAINAATSISGDVSKIIQDISSEPFPKLLPILAEDARRVLVSFGAAAAQMADSDPLRDLDFKGVVSALTAFIKVSGNLSDALIGQKGFFSQYAMLAPIRMALLSFKEKVEKFAMTLINFIPTESPFINQARGGLEHILQKTIKEFGPEHEL